MIKVHCFVSCVCEVIKKNENVDHRPFYFGVWDSDFDVTENGFLTYHSQHINHDFFKNWYELLYGIKITKWYCEERSKQENINAMLTLLETKPKHRHIMVMLDLSKLPERENKFHQSPFPHYVMLETTENEEEWFMFDPDFRWEGKLSKEKILEAIAEPSVEGGFYFDADEINPTNPLTVEAYFRTCMKLDKNPMTDAIRNIVDMYSHGEKSDSREDLANALKQIPVLAIRKYAYEHAFAFFWHELSLSEEWFESWCDEIEKLVKGYTTIQYRAMKYALTGDSDVLDDLHSILAAQNILEFSIKQHLLQVFEKWTITHSVKQLA
ncbi:hypothetical protein FIU87_10630 [Bacillus sp. THAF10]|uniref:DUF6005 family protein n=1 Tax=Bacillus sp. THAF10 TaxID=2587848 RepID=UPI001268E39B|nr:DUF6005 family protein [Bacillus sp. THAF10]QFT89102.1 hypothetical protein FIU87_10630 [Bacillus sp. THAF10]